MDDTSRKITEMIPSKTRCAKANMKNTMYTTLKLPFMRYLLLFMLSFVVDMPGIVAMPTQVILLRHGEKPEQGDTLSPQGFL